MRWKLATSADGNQCKKKLPWFKKDRMYCMDYIRPTAKTITFKSYGCMGVALQEYEEKDETPPVWSQSYVDGCLGDSGSGQFITNGYEINPKHFDKLKCILTSVATTMHKDKFSYGGKKYDVPCGTFSYDAKASKRGSIFNFKKRKYFRTTGVSQSTTFPNTLAWIKEKIKERL